MQKQDSLTEKENLLRQEIVDRNLDPDEFETFATAYRPEGGNEMENWPIEELKQAVEAFKSSKGIQDNQGNQGNTLSDLQIKQSQDFEINFSCQKIGETSLSSCETSISIGGYDISLESRCEIVPRYLVYPSYVVFIVTTSPQGYIVKRRYREFQSLRSALLATYPTLIVPPIPGKRRWTHEEAYLTKRKQFLERFLNNLLLSDVLRNDPYVHAFLSQSDVDFANTKNLKIRKVASIQEHVTVDGVVRCAITDDLNTIIHKSDVMFANWDELYKNLRNNCKLLAAQQAGVANTLYQLGENFAQFQQTLRQFSTDNNDLRIKTLEDRYTTLNNMMITWGTMVNIENRVITENLSNLFKFFHHQSREARELIQRRNQLKAQFEQDTFQLSQKKISLFSLGETSKWDITPTQLKDLIVDDKYDKQEVILQMLPKETQALSRLKNTFGAYNVQVCCEIDRILRDQHGQLTQYFIRYSRAQTDRIAKSHTAWASILNSLEGIETNPSLIRQQQDIIIETVT